MGSIGSTCIGSWSCLRSALCVRETLYFHKPRQAESRIKEGRDRDVLPSRTMAGSIANSAIGGQFLRGSEAFWVCLDSILKCLRPAILTGLSRVSVRR